MRTIQHPTDTVAVPDTPIAMRVRAHRLITVIALAAMVVGIGSVLGGLAGATYTWNQAAAQQITTPDDARFPEVPVRGPLSMWAQADIITHHQLDSTDGLYYAEMERQVPALDEAGEPVVDEAGEPVMVANEARASWVTATALTTSLQLGLMAYALAAFAIVVGLVLTGTGYALYRLRDAEVAVH
jgi:hypothetical protein